MMNLKYKLLGSLFLIGILFSQVPDHWEFSPSDYEEYMTLTASLSINGVASQQPYIMGIFAGDECRGYSEAIDVNGQYMYFVLIYSNNFSMFDIYLYDEANDVEYQASSEETLMFIPELPPGTIDAPFEVTFDCEDVDADGICDIADNCMGMFDECGVCNGNGIPDGFCDCSGNISDDCGVCGGENQDMDCAGVCFGDGVLDDCDVCNGVNQDLDCAGVCFGDAENDFCGVCSGGTTDHVMNSDLDCNGQCFGDAVFDECGVCGGNGIPDGFCDCDGNLADCLGVCGGSDVIDCNGLCGGGAVIDECGVCGGEGIPEGACDCDGNVGGCSMELSLLDDNNLISFYIIPDDNSVENVLSVFGDNAIGLVQEGVSAAQIETGWIGSLTHIDPTDGYWIKLIEAQTVTITGNVTDPNIEYNLLDGANLISFPFEGVYDISAVIPDDVETNFLGVIQEGVSAAQVEGLGWIGSLTTFQGGKGYWVILTEATDFSFIINSSTLSNSVQKNIE